HLFPLRASRGIASPGNGSQSLLHQVICSHGILDCTMPWTARRVAIPSSSGHLFPLARGGSLIVCLYWSQSLLHQVICSHIKIVRTNPEVLWCWSQSLLHQVICSHKMVRWTKG